MSEHKIKVAVLFGGVSSEHEISLLSVESVLSNLSDEYEVLRIGITKDGRWVEYTGADNEITSQKWETDLSLRTAVVSPDRSHHGFLMLGKDGSCEVVSVDVCFPVLHGKHGEDGTIQGLFQLAGIPFVGCNTISSANCMDKEMTHTILEANGIRMAKWVIVNGEKMAHFEEFAQQAEEKLGYPMFVKPANAGSSVGVGKAHNREELKKACEVALKEDYKAVVEECIEMQEVETAVLGNAHPQAAGVVGELVPVVEFYTYEAKYIDGTTVLHIPGRVSEETSLELRQTAEKAFAAIDCEGFARIDFFVRKSDGAVILNEINTIPGFTSISMYPKLWAHCGLSYPQLLTRLIELALERGRKGADRADG